MYEGLEKNLKNPIARFMIKQKKGKKILRTLQDFVMPGMHWYIRWYREGESNEVLRDCPALMLFHSPINEPVGAENCLIAAFHAIMMAHCLASPMTMRSTPVSPWVMRNINLIGSPPEN
jgi:hypothetical protein